MVSGSSGAAGINKLPSTTKPPTTAEIACALGAVARMTRAPPSFCNSATVSTAVGIDVVMRSEFARERFLILAAAERDCLESHATRVLHAEMSEASDALHGHDIARACAGITQRVVNRHARAHEWPGFFGRHFVRNPRQRFRRSDHVFGITAIVVDPGDLAINAHREITAPALVAGKIMSAVPADADALPCLPANHAVTERIDSAGDFMTRHARILKSWPQTFLDEHIAVANAACFHFHAHLPGGRFRDVAFHQFKISTGFADLRRFHFHDRSSSLLIRSVKGESAKMLDARRSWRRLRNHAGR